MQTVLSVNDNKAVIGLEGHFTFEAHRDFKEVTTNALAHEGVQSIELDLAGVDYLDSAALGMLLLLNERAAGRKVSLSNCKGTVKTVLDIANFGKIFEIR